MVKVKTQAINQMTEIRAVELLTRIALFKHLTAEEKRIFAEVPGLFRHAQAKTLFIEEGQPDNDIYIIMSGEARVLKNGQPVAKLTAGQFVGEVSFITREVRSASVEALTDMILVRIDKNTFQKLPIQARELVKDKIIAGLHQRVEQMNRQLLIYQQQFPND